MDDVLADRIIKALKEAPQITQKELVLMLDVPYRTLQRKMDELKVEGKTVDDEYVKKLDEAVHKARANTEGRREYMTLMMRDLENQEIGLEKGREEGRSIRDKEKIEEMLKRGHEPKEIADFCNYPLELILEVQKNLLVLQ